MNMNNSPTADQLRTLIAPMDDQAGHYIGWIDKSGIVHVDALDVDAAPIAFEKSIRATCSSGIQRLISVTIYGIRGGRE